MMHPGTAVIRHGTPFPAPVSVPAPRPRCVLSGPATTLATVATVARRLPRLWSSRRRAQRRFCELLVDGDSNGVEHICQARQMLQAKGWQVQTTVFATPGRFQNQRLQSFVEEEPLVFSQSVELNGKDSTDEAIIAELKSMAKMSFTFGIALLTADKDFFEAINEVASCGKPVTVILPIGRPGPTELYRSNPAVEVSVLQAANELGRFERVKATIRADGRGEVETNSLLRPEAPYAQLNGVLERLNDLGYYSPEDVYWNHALVKFWFANSLGDLPVYPPWALLDAVARVLEEPRQWTSKQQQMAFILPCADTWNLTPRMKDFYISRKAYSITKGCGPFVVPDSGESLAEEVLRRLGYDDEAAPEFTEFALSFFAQNKNKSKLRKADLLPIAGDTVSDVKGKLREAFLSHKVSDGEWLIPPAGDAVLKMLRKQGFDGSELEAMKAYAAAKQLPSRKTRIGYISMIQVVSV